jgi:single-stranded-DNA-specific exonuclease
MTLFEKILAARGLDGALIEDFLEPDYSRIHDPFLLPDMKKAVDRLVLANEKQEKLVIYGDYDIDGLTATALLLDAFKSFGFKNVDVFMPSRFVEGYGMALSAVEKIAADGVSLIVTVDCGSSSVNEIKRAKQLGVDVIVTDHHEVTSLKPSTIVVNPKLKNSNYPFRDLAGVGVAFKLAQALQTKLPGLDGGAEKWLLDLVALGTVCDAVSLTGENRTNVFWGLKVMSKTRRPGLKALMAISGTDPKKVNARSLGFAIGPRMNAAGRLETAKYALEALTSIDPMLALEKAQRLDLLNKERRRDQDKIVEEAIVQADKLSDDPVLVVSSPDWNHGIVGIVASKLMEKYHKPTFVLQELGDESKGSARSYGEFSVVDALTASKGIISKGGGHHFAAGVTLPTNNIAAFRKSVNDFYKSKNFANQRSLLLPKEDAIALLDEVDEELVNLINQLEPFGNGNVQPILRSDNLLVRNVRKMGDKSQHVKLDLQDGQGNRMQFLAFSAPEHFFAEVGSTINVWYQPDLNEWNNNVSVEGRLLHIEVND